MGNRFTLSELTNLDLSSTYFEWESLSGVCGESVKNSVEDLSRIMWIFGQRFWRGSVKSSVEHSWRILWRIHKWFCRESVKNSVENPSMILWRIRQRFCVESDKDSVQNQRRILFKILQEFRKGFLQCTESLSEIEQNPCRILNRNFVGLPTKSQSDFEQNPYRILNRTPVGFWRSLHRTLDGIIVVYSS